MTRRERIYKLLKNIRKGKVKPGAIKHMTRKPKYAVIDHEFNLNTAP